MNQIGHTIILQETSFDVLKLFVIGADEMLIEISCFF